MLRIIWLETCYRVYRHPKPYRKRIIDSIKLCKLQYTLLVQVAKPYNVKNLGYHTSHTGYKSQIAQLTYLTTKLTTITELIYNEPFDGIHRNPASFWIRTFLRQEVSR